MIKLIPSSYTTGFNRRASREAQRNCLFYSANNNCLVSYYLLDCLITGIINDFNDIVDLENLKAIHLNDSMYPLGSRRDRHGHIGKGLIGMSGFKAFVTHPAIRKLPMVLETPKDAPGSDKRNLSRIRKLCAQHT